MVANLTAGWSPGGGAEVHAGASGTHVIWQSKPTPDC
jgi:hypothetical protein